MKDVDWEVRLSKHALKMEKFMEKRQLTVGIVVDY